MAKVYDNPGVYAYSTYQQAEEVALKSNKAGWIYEVNEFNLQQEKYLGWTFYPTSTAGMNSLVELGFIPRARVDVTVTVHPMFTGVLVNKEKQIG